MSSELLLLTATEAAKRLSLSRSLVYELLLRGELPSLKIGRARRIPLASLEDYIDLHLTTPRHGKS